MSVATGRITLAEWLSAWRLDVPLLGGLLLCLALGLMVLYSASGQSSQMMINQALRMGTGLIAMFAVAQVPPEWYRTAAPWLYGLSLVMLLMVITIGATAMGAQRWLDVGFIRFQPSELVKLAVPLFLAAYLHDRRLPPSFLTVCVGLIIMVAPALLIGLQPDLGTALLVVAAGTFVIFLAGVTWRSMLFFGALAAAAVPLLWYNMHAYQRTRVLTLLNPASDPSGAGYHITQSKIAIGSGGVYGKGWLNGSQAHLNFLPESNTDFVFAVFAEETGLMGVLALFAIYSFIILRGLYIAWRSQETFQRLLAGSISLTFFVYVFVNIGMVIGILPVVGVPLPLVSYGGTSMVVLLMAFGMLMSINTHRRLLSS